MKHFHRWFVYTYATRVLLFGTGPNGTRLTGFQFTVSQMLKLPYLDSDPSPVPSTDLGAFLNTGSKSKWSPTKLSADDIVLLRSSFVLSPFSFLLDCTTVSSSVMSTDKESVSDSISFLCKTILFSFRNLLFRDILMLAREYEMCNDALHFNIVDNVLLIQHTNSSVVAMYDLASPSSLPIGSPLPASSKNLWKSCLSSSFRRDVQNIGSRRLFDFSFDINSSCSLSKCQKLQF